MPKIALLVVLSLAVAAPVAAQQRGEKTDRPDPSGRNEAPETSVIVPTTATISPRTRGTASVTRTRQSFTMPWFTGVYQ